MTSATSIRAWAADGILYESYRYAPGPAEALPRHAHAEYQLTLSFGFPGEYRYRGARHRVPEESLTVLHPGEAHSVHDPRDRDAVATFLMMYVPAPAFERAPFLAEPVIRDPSLLRLATALHAVSRDEVQLLRHDELRAELLARLASGPAARPTRARVRATGSSGRGAISRSASTSASGSPSWRTSPTSARTTSTGCSASRSGCRPTATSWGCGSTARRRCSRAGRRSRRRRRPWASPIRRTSAGTSAATSGCRRAAIDKNVQDALRAPT